LGLAVWAWVGRWPKRIIRLVPVVPPLVVIFLACFESES
jgi:hypothetical protein